VAPRERIFDLRLALEQPVERHVQLILVDFSQAEHAAEAGGGGGRIERLGGGELRHRCYQASHDHRHDQIATAIAGRPEQLVEPDAAQRTEHGRDVPVWQ